MEYSDLVRMYVSETRMARFREVASFRLSCLRAVFDRVYDCRNVNACVRVADAFGVGEVHYLSEERYRAEKAISMACDRWVTVHSASDDAALAESLRGDGFTLVGTVVLGEEGEAFDSFVLPERAALVIGAERRGMSEEMRGFCDCFVTIPTVGFADSLNLSTAAAIILRDWSVRYRQRGKDASLPPAVQEALVAEWVRRDVIKRLNRRGTTLEDVLG